MRGLITHEESQVVTSAFNNRGHNFKSNDLKDCSGGRPDLHLKGDCFLVTQEIRIIENGIDFWGGHPDCTFLTNAGIRWLTSVNPRSGYTYSNEYDVYINQYRWSRMEDACEHFVKCYHLLADIGKGYLENPRMHPYAAKLVGVPSTQIIHPYYFGSPQMKETHLWIVGLPDLIPDNMLTKPTKKDNYQEWLDWQNVWMASPGPKRAEYRSKTDLNVARAFSEQWG